MLDGLFSSSRGPGIIGACLALAVVAGFGSLIHYASNDSGELTIEQQIINNQEAIESLEKQIDNVAVLKRKHAKNQLDYEELRSLEDIHDKCLKDIESGKTLIQDMKSEGLAVKTKFESYREKYRKQVRNDAIGEEHKEFITTDGKTYKDVTFEEISDLDIKIKHSRGKATYIPYDVLPKEYADRFQVSNKAAEMQAAIREKESAENAKNAELNNVEKEIRALEAGIEKAKKTIIQKEEEYKNLKRKESDLRSKEKEHKNKAIAFRAKGNRGQNFAKARKEEEKAARINIFVRKVEREAEDANGIIRAAKKKVPASEQTLRSLKRKLKSLKRQQAR